MDFIPQSNIWSFIRKGTTAAKKTIGQNVKIINISLYRYDSTGRLVHYGPKGEILENDSAFQVTDAQSSKSAISISASKTLDHIPQ
jgi:hypothetical protein